MKEERSGRSGWRWWAIVGAAGAGALAFGYFFDPELGRGRRLRLAGRASHLARRGTHRVLSKARYWRQTARLQRRQLEHGFPPKRVEGLTLLDRVESELFTDPQIPRGRLNLEVEGTVVVLRGQLASGADIRKVEDGVLRVPGVGGVRNLLHLKGTPAPNKAAALLASARAGRA
jgi:hypothetical protein